MTSSAPPNDLAVEAQGLTKRFGSTHALAGVDLQVSAGTVLGLLGPNGAGKTTTVRVLTTLLRPDGGTARVAGCDVVRQPQQVRQRIGLTGQYAALDGFQNGRNNLIMIGRLAGLNRRQAKIRAAELLTQFELEDAATRAVKGYSGGMRRRLDLAASLVARPALLFLDEPTTGLDPRSRLVMWDVIRRLVTEGTTLLLTTQYLEEADQLADRIVVIDHGRVIAQGAPLELKSAIGGAYLDLTVSEGSDLDIAATAIRPFGNSTAELKREERKLLIPINVQPHITTKVINAMNAVGVYVDDCTIRRPSLDDVFLSLTGRPSKQTTDDSARQMELTR